VAPYTSFLSPQSQLITYAQFLCGIRESNERERCLNLASTAGLDVPSITSKVVELNIKEKDNKQIETYRGDRTAQVKPVSSSGTTNYDLDKIHSIEWLCFDSVQREEALKQANALVRDFVEEGKLEAARLVYGGKGAILPEDTITVVLSRISEGDSLNKHNMIQEHGGLSALLAAHESCNEWMIHHNKEPPAPLSLSNRDAKQTERIEYDERVRRYRDEMNRWRAIEDRNTQNVIESIDKVLHFPNGWLLDRGQDEFQEPPPDARKTQMHRLRRKCIPEMCDILHSITHRTGNFRESVEIATIVADEHFKLYSTFSQAQLQKLLSSIQQSALELLHPNNQRDNDLFPMKTK